MIQVIFRLLNSCKNGGVTEKIRVTKTFTFECAHALSGYDGSCKNIHGHSYKLRVTILGIPEQTHTHPKNGMVIDFKDLKKLVQNEVIAKWDHALLIKDGSLLAHEFPVYKTNVVLTSFQPTCENMLLEIKSRLQSKLEYTTNQLISLRLDETATAFAEWHLSDQSQNRW